MAAPTFVQRNGFAFSNPPGPSIAPGGLFSATFGVAPVAGHLLVLSLSICRVGGTFPFLYGLPAGWTIFPGSEDAGGGGFDFQSVVAYKTAGPSEPSTVSVTNTDSRTWDRSALLFIGEYAGLSNGAPDSILIARGADSAGTVFGQNLPVGGGPRVIVGNHHQRTTQHTPALAAPFTARTEPPVAQSNDSDTMWWGDRLVDAAAASYQPQFLNTGGAGAQYETKTLAFMSGQPGVTGFVGSPGGNYW